VLERPDRPAGWFFHPRARPVEEPLDLLHRLDDGLEVHMVFARDGAYVPAVIQRPAGEGPFPAVMVMHGGSGGLGWAFLAEDLRRKGFLFARLLEEGYLVCYTEGRREVEDAYGTDHPGPLDYEDVAEVFGYLGRLPDVDASRIGTFGVSHGGELQMKLLTQLGGGPAAAVPTEPAVIEYLSLQHHGGSEDAGQDWTPEDSSGPRSEELLQYRRHVEDGELDFERAWERIQRVPADVPILVLGRDDDHLQGLFNKLHELLERAGKRAEWDTFDHPEHYYQWGNEDGSPPDAIQEATLARIVGFLNANVRDR
jgi:dienelactone hydrolase